MSHCNATEAGAVCVISSCVVFSLMYLLCPTGNVSVYWTVSGANWTMTATPPSNNPTAPSRGCASRGCWEQPHPTGMRSRSQVRE